MHEEKWMRIHADPDQQPWIIALWTTKPLSLPPGQVPVDNGPQLAVLQPDIVQVEADVLDLHVAAEGDPAAAEPPSVRGRVGDGRPHEAVIAATHGLHLVFGDGGGQVTQEDTRSLVKG